MIFAQRSFAAGEVSPYIYPRVDTIKYATGLRTCRNSLIMRHGGSASRPGTQFVAEVKDSTRPVRLIPFVFNISQSYVLEFGNQYMRVYRNGVQMTLSAAPINAITRANPAVVTTAFPHGLSNGQEIAISGSLGMTEVNGRNFKVEGATSTTFQLYTLGNVPVDSSGYGVYAGWGQAAPVYEISTPYMTAELAALKFTESADALTIAHPNHPPQELDRFGDTSWTLTPISFGTSIAAPTSVNPNNLGTGTPTQLLYAYVVTAVNSAGEESVASLANAGGVNMPVSVTWNPVSGAVSYNIYKTYPTNYAYQPLSQGPYGYIGSAVTTDFLDQNIIPDFSNVPPVLSLPFPGTGHYPSTVTYFQQRLVFANSNSAPETVWGSRTGAFKNFNYSTPSQSDDAVTFTLVSRQVNQVKHLLDIGNLVILTSGGEWVVNGNTSEPVTPTNINLKQYSYNGVSDLAPIVVGGNALYVQARGSIVRDLFYEFQSDSYKGNDLTIFSSHLVDKYTLVDWAYQQVPHSVVWVARSDGGLLGLTYVREQQLVAWHRHDFDGSVENVCTIPEGTGDSLYLVLNRTVNGRRVRYLERMASRVIQDIVDYVGMDASLTYDGRNSSAITMEFTLTTASWTYQDTLTLTASSSFFTAGMVGDQVQLTGSDGTLIRFTITNYVSATVVQGHPHKTVPASMQFMPIATWAHAVMRVGGLWHLEGKAVSVFADGFVVSSPNNANVITLTVTNGTITLDRPYAVIHAGLPFISDIETLDLDSATGQTLADKPKNVGKVIAYCSESRGLWAGARPPESDGVDPLQGLEELKIRDSEDYDQPVALATGPVEILLNSEWNMNGRVFIRQVDPVPLAVLAVAAGGYVPVQGAY